ncbi:MULTISPECIES: hypothetical protein [unclassified Mesorhizobium]|uniref:hypothetical protein n=1 Tax=unclassified Mesorhizobium TaxID=325217 RepID=UPI000FCCB14D|nr:MULTISPECIES: hypothetical protein [unclassified Mesorhizobium]RUW01429.1 hypothetical protein EOA49_11270 [Mesorhizobium sp. M1A.F.Ca.IN.020.04.1.1]RUW12026.1 hypothetical protein EOA53_11430 [Mesorhizobium sp. M1A.F.Ca.IN.020.03.1.1]
MKNVILRSIVVPLASRAGTALATYVVAKWGLDGTLADQFANGVLAVVLVGCDIITSKALSLVGIDKQEAA